MRLTPPLLAAALTTALLFLSAGCSGPKPADLQREVPEAFPNHTFSEIRKNILVGTDTLTGFKAKARLEMDTPEQSGRFGASLRQRRADSLLLSINAGLGLEAARILVTPDSFFVHERLMRSRLTYGALADAGEELPAPLATGDVFDNLLGLVAPEDGVAWQVSADGENYRVSDASGQLTYTVDPALWRVTRYEERTESGALVEERVFSEFDRIGGVVVPRQVLFRRPADDVSVAISYRDLTLNPKGLDFPFRIDDGTERVLVSRN